MKLYNQLSSFDALSASTGLCCEDKSLAIQSQAEEADINTIVKRFGLTGQLPQNVRVPLEDDFYEATDYRSALEAVRQADESFMKMPASVRARFNHNPAEFVEFCMDKANLDEMHRLGLAVTLPELGKVEAATPVATP